VLGFALDQRRELAVTGMNHMGEFAEALLEKPEGHLSLAAGTTVRLMCFLSGHDFSPIGVT